jgi:hypothetical protein
MAVSPLGAGKPQRQLLNMDAYDARRLRKPTAVVETFTPPGRKSRTSKAITPKARGA